MFLNSSKIIGLKVYTQSGELLGELKDLEINAATQAITAYLVASNKLLKRLMMPQLIIKPAQVISLDETKMVVEDTLSVVPSALVKAPSV